MTDALEAALDAEAELDQAPGERPKCIVFLQDSERGGLQLHGYEEDTDAIVDLFVHLRAIFRANGKELMLAGLGKEVGHG
jgi:hypothetical protein